MAEADQTEGAGASPRPEPSSDNPGRFGQCLCACMLAHGAGRYERFMRDRKRHLFGELGEGGDPASSTVLEIGAGTGVNVEFLPRQLGRYIAIEPNPYMHRHLKRAALKQGLELDLRPQTFEHADIDEGSVDAVVCTLVLCSVNDPGAVLQRVLRLLRPGGRFVFVEHVAAAQGTWLRAIQRGVRPVWRVLGDGCRPDRETWKTIDSAGFASVKYARFSAPLPVVSPHIAGIAVKEGR